LSDLDFDGFQFGHLHAALNFVPTRTSGPTRIFDVSYAQ